MKKIFLLIFRFLVCCFGLLSICFGLLGIILCTHSKNSFTLVMSVLFTVLFLSGGFYSLYNITIKKTVSTKAPSAYAMPSSTKPENDSPASPVQYVESNNSIICRADGKPISDKEIPYLIQVGREEVVAKRRKEKSENFIEDIAPTENCAVNISSGNMSQPIEQPITQPVPEQMNAKNESAINQLETALNRPKASLDQLNQAVSSGNIVKVTVQHSNTSPTVPISGIPYIEDDKMISRTDGKEITDKEIPYLIQVGLEQALKDEKESPNPKFHRTTREKDLSFNFEMKYSHEIDSLTEKFEALYRESFETDNLEEKITLLTEAISAFEKAKKFCYSKGKGGTIYFQDMWEYLHNSRTPCFSYLENIQDALEEAVYLKGELIPAIIELVAKNDLILQKDIYKILPDIDKSIIQHTIKHLEADKIISRIKKGNSYELHILD